MNSKDEQPSKDNLDDSFTAKTDKKTNYSKKSSQKKVIILSTITAIVLIFAIVFLTVILPTLRQKTVNGVINKTYNTKWFSYSVERQIRMSIYTQGKEDFKATLGEEVIILNMTITNKTNENLFFNQGEFFLTGVFNETSKDYFTSLGKYESDIFGEWNKATNSWNIAIFDFKTDNENRWFLEIPTKTTVVGRLAFIVPTTLHSVKLNFKELDESGKEYRLFLIALPHSKVDPKLVE